MPATIEDIAPKRHFLDEIRHLESGLVLEKPTVPPAVIHDWVEREHARFANARVRSFVPILVERAVRARLRAADSVVPYSPAGGSLPEWARRTAEALLAAELPRRWAHTRGVAGRAREVAVVLPPADRPVLVAAAWLHDIGYASPVTGTGLHSLDGARYLLRHRVPPRVCALIAHHSGAAAVAGLSGLSAELAEFADERGLVRDALWYCDMTTSPTGERVTFAERMAEIRTRRGPEDPVVRALDVNVADRAAAVTRTSEALQRHGRIGH